jgi:hypothetical protein
MVLGKIFNIAGDFLKSADFEIKGDMKVGHIQDRFEENFGLTLRVYHGVKFAEPDKTLRSISTIKKKKDLDASDNFTIRASMTLPDVSKLFADAYGLKVKIADRDDDHLMKKHLTIGDAQREQAAQKLAAAASAPQKKPKK